MGWKYFLLMFLITIAIQFWIHYVEHFKKRYPKQMIIDGTITPIKSGEAQIHLTIDLVDYKKENTNYE